jgi:trk system potassium uptake protein
MVSIIKSAGRVVKSTSLSLIRLLEHLENVFTHRILFPRRLLKLTPALMVVLSFIALIFAGTIILMLPYSTHSGTIPFSDALFTATSAVCVTGLIVVDTGSYFTLFGQLTILVLIQIGGLGVMTISVMLFRAVGRSISFRQRMAMQEIFAHTPREDIFRLVRTILLFSLVAESVGTLVLFLRWLAFYPAGEAFYLALFHAISGFCNAGFSLFPDSLMRFSGDWSINLTIGTLIILGGIGFPVIYDLGYKFFIHKGKRYRLSLQTKTVLVTSLSLIIVGTLTFYALEHHRTLNGKGLPHALLISFFQSVTCRTAGFNSIDIAILHDATLMMMATLMFFGASPGSAGGGVKTTTLALIVAFTWSRIRRKKRVDLFKKSIPVETVSRSVSLILVCTGLIGTVLFLLLAGEAMTIGARQAVDHRFILYLFESVSAFGTVGLSMGITPFLSAWGKYLIILLMLVGRAGVLSFAYIIVGGGIADGPKHSEENIMIG